MLALKFMHLLCWVYWLGGDLGTFYSSRFVANASLAPAARAIAAKIMMGTDIAPRLCMPLTVVTGLHLASISGTVAISTPILWAIWLACAVWLWAIWSIHHGNGSSKLALIVQLDFGLRVVLLVGLGATACAGLFGAIPGLAPWLAFKLLCFAGTVACGLAIRIQLRPFGPAFARLMAQGPDAAGDQAIQQSIAACIPYVVSIWILLLLSAATGLHWLNP